MYETNAVTSCITTNGSIARPKYMPIFNLYYNIII
jgi:hypothetical protein